MLQKFIHFIAYGRHPWRHMQFDELAEIYTSMMIRSLGFSLMGVFVPIYLYNNGVSVQNILLFFAFTFLLRIPSAFFIAKIVGRIGPKHSIAISTIVLIIFLSMLMSYAQMEWPLVSLAFFFTFANGLFYVAYHTDFSKVQHAEHGGKEVGFSIIFERLGFAVGPIVGGVLASLFVPELTIFFAMIILVLSLLPLFLTNEPVKIHQHIRFKGFEWKKYTRNFVVISGLNIEHIITISLWPLYLSLIVFSDDAYAEVGLLVGFGTALSVVAARFFGKVIDAKKGYSLLLYGSVLYAFLHVLRVYVSTPAAAVIMNTASEPTALAVRIPVTKGFFDEGDSAEGFRIVYFAMSEVVLAVVKSVLFLLLYLIGFFVESKSLLQLSFLIAAAGTLLTLMQRFPALKKV